MTRRLLAGWRAAAAIATLVPTASQTATASAPPAPAPAITSVLWMGDSLAYELTPGVETALRAAGIDVAIYAYPGISITGDAWLPPGETWIYDTSRCSP